MRSPIDHHLRSRAAVAALIVAGCLGAAVAAGAQGEPGNGGAASAPVAGLDGGPAAERAMGGGLGRRGLDFAGIDADGNGSLSREELINRARSRIVGVDANGDGRLDRAELIAAMPAPGGPLVDIFAEDPAAAHADRLLAALGATEAGVVPVEVLVERRADMVLERLDLDGNGAVTSAELALVQEKRSHHRHEDGPRGGKWWDRPHGRHEAG